MSFALVLKIYETWISHGLPGVLPQATAMTALTASAMQLGPRLLKAAPEVLDTVPALYKKFTNAGLAQGPQRGNDSEQSLDDTPSDVPALYADGDAGGPLSLLPDDAEALTAPALVLQQTTPSLRAEPVQPTTLPSMINLNAFSHSSHQHEAFTNATCPNNTLQLNITIDAQYASGPASTLTAASDGPLQRLSFPTNRLQPTILVSVCVVILSIVIFFKLLFPRSITSMWTRLSSYFKPEVILTPSNTAEMLALQERYPSGDVSSSRDIERRQTYQVKMHKYEMNKAKAERAEPDAAAWELDEAGAEPGARADEDAQAAAPEDLAAGHQPSTFVVPIHAASCEPAAHAEGPLLDNGMQMDDAVDSGIDPLARTVDVRPPQDSESDLFVVASASTELDTAECLTDARACDDSLPFPPTASMDTIDLLDEPPRRWTRAEKGKWRADTTPQDVAQLSPPRALASTDAAKADEDTRGPPARRAQVHRSAHHARALASIVPIVRRRGQQARRLRARRARATRAWSAVARLAYYTGAEGLDPQLPSAPPPSPEADASDFTVAGAVNVAGDAALEKNPLSSLPSASMDAEGMLDASPRRYTRAEKGKQRADFTPADDALTEEQSESSFFAESRREAEARGVDALLADAHRCADMAQSLATQAPQVDRHIADIRSSSPAHRSVAKRPLPFSSSCPAMLPSMLPMFLSHVAARRSPDLQASDSSSATQTSMRLRSEGETSGEGLVYFTIKEFEELCDFLHVRLDGVQTELEEKYSMRSGDENMDEEGRDDDVFDEGRDEEDGGRTDDEDRAEDSYEDGQGYFEGSDGDEQTCSENSDDGDEQGYLEDSDEDVEDVAGPAQAEVDVRAEAANGRHADVDVQRDDAHVHHGNAGAQPEAVQQLDKVPVQDQDIDTHHAEDAGMDGQDKDVDVQQADVEDRRVDRENLRANVDDQPADVADQHVAAEEQRLDDGIQRTPPSPHPAHGLAREVNDKQVPGNDDNDERVPDTIAPEAVVATDVEPKLEAAADDEPDMAAAKVDVKVHAPLDAKDPLPVEPVDADDQRSVAPVNEEGMHPVEHVDAQDRRPVEHVDAQEQHPVAPIADLRVPVEAGIDVAVQQAPHMPHLAGDLAQESDDEQVPADDVDDDDGEEVSDDDEQVPDVDEEQVPEDEEEQMHDDEHEQAPGGTGPIAGTEPDARAEVRAPVEPAVAEEQLPVEPVAAEPLPVAPVNMKDERPVEPIIPEEQLAAERADADLRAPVKGDATAAMQQENEVRVNGLADGEARADLDGPADDGVVTDNARLEGEDTDKEEDDAVLPDIEAEEAPVDGAEEAAGDRDEDAGPALAVPGAAVKAEHRVDDVDVRVEARLVQRVNTRTEGPQIAYAVSEYEKTGAPATTWIPFPGVALPRTPLQSPRLPKVGAGIETIDRAEMDEGGLLMPSMTDRQAVGDRGAAPPSPPISPVTERGLRNITNLQPHIPARPAKEARIATFV